ncbi:uncharacterized protein MELLADRAFT_102400 [Melampsora larici-populina 98AG31]|uniref:Uncharacterized protein n=1 Tax=Melampsora larici-populina (strain 98AG31 / pathotype 3-4-7) TaxID=747676 RepID=F4R861_MELLP|nr:uncharacterized protein MELLADRAFT_102400 [Melampsora larici-populina 98AG31]EGG11436.1 hypothetical protein MELLADRAFT_102400 [Melampsora larici-populina 98AG31]
MDGQDQGSTQAFNKDVNNILIQHEKEKGKIEEGGQRGRGTSKATRGRGRGSRRGRGGTATTRKTRSITKGKIREPREELEEEDNEEGSELSDIVSVGKMEEKEEDREVEEKEIEENEGDEDIISLDKAEFVAENAHIDREHEQYLAELTRLYRKGNTGRYDILDKAYTKWCKRIGTDPRGIKMLDASSEEEEDVESGAGKRKAKECGTEKSSKIAKKMNHGKVLTHRLIDLAPYWDNRMKACFGYVPLTIFVPAWLLADKNHMSNWQKQSSSCSDVVAYVGLRVPSEWRQSFLMWSTLFHLYVQYWRMKYQQEEIACRLEEHYKIVLDIKAKNHDAFAPALRFQVGWDMISNGDEQITAVTGGRMFSHLAPSGRNQSHAPTGQFFGEVNGHYGNHQHESVEGAGGVNFHQGSRGRGKRGRGFNRGNGNRGGGTRGGAPSGPTTVVNGVTVPKFGPGAFEAVKAAKQAGVSGNSAGTQ